MSQCMLVWVVPPTDASAVPPLMAAVGTAFVRQVEWLDLEMFRTAIPTDWVRLPYKTWVSGPQLTCSNQCWAVPDQVACTQPLVSNCGRSGSG